MHKISALFISLIILIILYLQIDLNSLVRVLGNIDWQWFALATAMIVPLTAISAWRISILAPRGAKLGFLQSLNLTLMASVLNAILPSKMGDIVRSYALVEKKHLDMENALSLVIFEKAWDVLSLSFLCSLGLFWVLVNSHITEVLFYILASAVITASLLGVLMVSSLTFARGIFSIAQNLIPNKKSKKIRAFRNAWLQTIISFWANRPKAYTIISGSIFLWLMHLCQIWFFVFALKSEIPFIDNIAMASLSIFVGLLPFTVAGIGTRDAAIIFFYQPYIGAPASAALGLMCTLRYFLPALIGLPLIRRYLVSARHIKQILKINK